MRRTVLPEIILLLSAAGPVALAQTSVQDEIRQLKQQIAAQQEQIDELRRMLQAQSGVAIVKPATPVAPADNPAGSTKESGRSPLALGIGPVVLTPTGFVDYAQVWRSKTVASGLPTNFAAIPFNNTVEGHRRQTLATAANSRVGMQVDASLARLRLLGVVEADFLGYQPGNISITTNSYGMRMRLAFADVQSRKWEFLGGQAWSLLTPGREGIPTLPSGLVLTQDLDPNIQSGLVWARTPQLRVAYRPRRGVALAAAFESGDTYVGGSGGSGTITLPAALAPNYYNQVDLGSGGLGVPNPHLDFIGKVAFDWTHWGHSTHLEAAGMMNRFAFYNPLNDQRFSVMGGGASLSIGFELARHLSLFSSNFYSDGGGRYIYGEAPALIIRGNGQPSLVTAMSTLDGLEYQVRPKLKLWAYYGGTFIDRNSAIDPSNGKPVGYGYEGSPNSQNRAIQEITGGFTRVLYRDPMFGVFQISGQYSWIVRHPWYVAPGQPGSANLNMLYLGLRYQLPSAPSPGR